MELCDGYRITEMTDKIIVQETVDNSIVNGEQICAHVIIKGNPHPDGEQRQKLLDEVAGLLTAEMINKHKQFM